MMGILQNTNAHILHPLRRVEDVHDTTDIVIDLLHNFFRRKKSMNNRSQFIQFSQAKLFACGFVQIRRQTFSDNISTLIT